MLQWSLFCDCALLCHFQLFALCEERGEGRGGVRRGGRGGEGKSEERGEGKGGRSLLGM